jgi:hypothetical protein
MRASSKYESMAAVLALFGAVALVAVYYPIINPEQFSLDAGRDSMPLIWYIVGTPIALFILVTAWCLNCKAARLKREDQHSDVTSA